MLSRIVNVVFALTAAAPILISVGYVDARKSGDYQLAIIALFTCVLLGALAIQIIRLASHKLEVLNVKFTKIKSANRDVIGFYIAYVLPLLFRGAGLADFGSLILGSSMLVYVIWATRSLQVNPVLGMLGYSFYEAETDGGITYLLITKRTINSVKNVTDVCQLTTHGLLDVTFEKKSL